MIRLINSRVLHKAFIGIGLFVIATFFIEASLMIEIANGLFIGVVISIGLMFRQIVWQALSNKINYGRVEHFALGFALLWISVIMNRIDSIWVRSMVSEQTTINISYYNTALITFVAVTAGIIQITAPGWGNSVILRHDKRVLIWSIIAGLVVALGAFALQRYKLLLYLYG